MAEHTPGPWHYNGTTPTIYAPAPKKRVARVLWTDDQEFPGVSVQMDDDEANGRLIAAAPDLLAACRDVMNAAANVDPAYRLLEGAYELDQAVERACAAFDKAMGYSATVRRGVDAPA